MKIAAWTKYGPPEVLRLIEIEKPVPKEREILIKVHAATVTNGDCEVRRFNIPLPFIFWLPLRLMTGFFKPKKGKTLGQEFAGEVVEVGEKVGEYKKGDKVFGGTGMGLNAYAEYRIHNAKYPLSIKPSNVSYEEAAAANTGGINALHFLRLAEINKGDTVLVNGAGGSIGTYAVQLAKLMGASEVTAIDSAAKLEMLTAIGADHVIDYTKVDYTTLETKYDVIIDVVGTPHYKRTVRRLKEGGRLFLGNPRGYQLFWAPITSRFSNKRVRWLFAGDNKEDLDYLAQLFDEGKIKSVIDRRFPLEQIVEAHRYVESGQKKGNVVITIPA